MKKILLIDDSEELQLLIKVNMAPWYKGLSSLHGGTLHSNPFKNTRLAALAYNF